VDQRLTAAIIRNARAFHAMAWTDDDRVAAHSAYHSVITIELGLKAMTLRTGKGSADAERISASVDRLAPTITPDALARFATAAQRKLRDRTSGYRRDHLRALTQRVDVISKTEARIIGSRTELLRALASGDGGSYAAAGGVLGFKPKWRTRSDSNARPPDS
jgi:site-specific DNA recombinase